MKKAAQNLLCLLITDVCRFSEVKLNPCKIICKTLSHWLSNKKDNIFTGDFYVEGDYHFFIMRVKGGINNFVESVKKTGNYFSCFCRHFCSI